VICDVSEAIEHSGADCGVLSRLVDLVAAPALGENLGFEVASIGFLKQASSFGFCFAAGFSSRSVARTFDPAPRSQGAWQGGCIFAGAR
jgi:hypothetical protein